MIVYPRMCLLFSFRREGQDDGVAIEINGACVRPRFCIIAKVFFEVGCQVQFSGVNKGPEYIKISGEKVVRVIKFVCF